MALFNVLTRSALLVLSTCTTLYAIMVLFVALDKPKQLFGLALVSGGRDPCVQWDKGMEVQPCSGFCKQHHANATGIASRHIA